LLPLPAAWRREEQRRDQERESAPARWGAESIGMPPAHSISVPSVPLKRASERSGPPDRGRAIGETASSRSRSRSRGATTPPAATHGRRPVRLGRTFAVGVRLRYGPSGWLGWIPRARRSWGRASGRWSGCITEKDARRPLEQRLHGPRVQSIVKTGDERPDLV